MNSLISSDGHAGFYSAFGITLAVIFTPLIQSIFDIPIAGFEDEGLIQLYDALFSFIGAAGLITGLLYLFPLDKIGDTILKNRAIHDAWQIRNSWKKKQLCNNELLVLVAEIDRMVTNWNRLAWVPVSETCRNIVESTVHSPHIQKSLWKIKNKAGMGLLFILWSITLVGRVGDAWVYLVISGIFGVLVFYYAAYHGSATKMTRRLRQVAFIEYGNDALKNWQPSSQQRRNNTAREMMAKLEESASDLERIVASGQWVRFNQTYSWFVQELKKTKPIVANISKTLKAAWCGAFAEYTLARAKGEEHVHFKEWFLKVLESFILTDELKTLNWSVKPNHDNFADPHAFFSSPTEDNLIYRTSNNAAHLLAASFNALDVEEKVLWVNAASDYGQAPPPSLKLSFYEFGCEYKSDGLTSKSYEYLTKHIGQIRITSLLLLTRIETAEIPLTLKVSFFDKVQSDTSVEGGVSNMALKLMQRFREKL